MPNLGENYYNILHSARGLVRKTHQGTYTMAKNVDGLMLMKQGDLYTDPETGMLGVVADTYQFIGNEEFPVSVIEAGHLRADRVAAEVTAQADALIEQGLYLVAQD